MLYEWAPPQMFSVDIAFYNYFITMWRKAMISDVVENSWNWNFADFRDLVLILPEAATGSVLYSQENTCARVSF